MVASIMGGIPLREVGEAAARGLRDAVEAPAVFELFCFLPFLLAVVLLFLDRPVCEVSVSS